MGDSIVSGRNTGLEIAIIGMSSRFPGADNVDEFWENLRDGVESISFFTDEELLSSGVEPGVINHPDYVKAAGVLKNDIGLFDASFFGFSPKEAEIMDPQHRMFLECAWEALESSGYNTEQYEGLIGVYAGVGVNKYLIRNLFSSIEFKAASDFRGLIGNDKDFLSTRVSYKLNLGGPSVVVQSACSTSLVAVHLACQSLIAGECDIALAGGVSVVVPQISGYLYHKGGILSADGHCRAFDARAQGTVAGSGAGIVVLKRLADALEKRDSILAVIKGSSVNNDGAQKVGYTAPSVDGQDKVISTAQAMAGVDPETVSYIEAHGTGTALGDPIEIAALTQAFRIRTQKKGFCAIGSVKTNIGHLDTAAGVAGLIKTVLMLNRKQIPPSLHFEQSNSDIDLANSPFYVNTKLIEWENDNGPRRAGVSSFGLGGTNAHVVLEEAPGTERFESSRPYELLLLSAKTNTALDIATENLGEYLRDRPEERLADVAYTLQVGRRSHSHRRIIVCHDALQAQEALLSKDPRSVLSASTHHLNRPIAFMFPGIGDHYPGMGHGLYQSEAVFRQQVDLCCQILRPQLGIDLREVIYPSLAANSEAKPDQTGRIEPARVDLRKMLRREAETEDEATRRLNRTAYAQPAVFVVEYALAQMLKSWGIEPEVMIGYSLGEYVAACLAGVFKLEDALYLVAKRAEMIEETPEGAMLVVGLGEEQALEYVGEGLWVAADNGPRLSVMAGAEREIKRLDGELRGKGVVCSRLGTRHAFHTKMMEEVAGRYVEEVKRVELRKPQVRYISNVSGRWIREEEATDASYWGRHLREAMRYREGIERVMEGGERILVEVGPGQALSGLAKDQGEKVDGRQAVTVATMRHNYEVGDDKEVLLRAIGRIWMYGGKVNWEGMNAGRRRRRIALPTYPFQRQRYWVEPQPQTSDLSARPTPLDKKPDVADWFYLPYWKPTFSPRFDEPEGMRDQAQRWLVFIDECGVGSQIAERLEQGGQEVVKVLAGDRFDKLGDRAYTIDARERDHYAALLEELRKRSSLPEIILHLWTVMPDGAIDPGSGLYEKIQAHGFYSLLLLAQAIGEQRITDPVQIAVFSNNMQRVTGEERLVPEKATVLGPCRVIPQEYTNLSCRTIDLSLPPPGSLQWDRLITRLISDLMSTSADPVVAYRNDIRWAQAFEPIRIEERSRQTTTLRRHGVYLITGGLGGLGLALAEYLARTVQAKLVLIGRSVIPVREEWDRYDEQDRLSDRIKKLKALEDLGAEVEILCADAADYQQMRDAVDRARERFGSIHGVVHAAGVPGAGLIQLKTIEKAAEVIYPKVNGAIVLQRVFQGEPLDFIALYSANTSIIGGLGQVDYCAANAFLDAFAHSHTIRSGIPTVSIDWCAWQWDDWQETLTGAIPEAQAEFRRLRDAYGLSFAEGTDAFSRVLLVGAPQVVVSTQDFQSVRENHNKFAAQDFVKHFTGVRSSITSHARPALETDYVPPRSDAERRIVRIWQELLGIEQIGIHDNFFHLGGHSLLGIHLISRLEESFQVSLPLRSLFERPTIAGFSLLIEEMLIAEIDTLTEDEARLLSSSEVVS